MVNHIKKLWKGICDIKEIETNLNSETGLMETYEKLILSQIPCLLVSKTSHATRGEISEIKSSGNLIVEKDLQIKEGSKIIVTQNGFTAEYAFSGFPKVYENHREIPVTLLRRWT